MNIMVSFEKFIQDVRLPERQERMDTLFSHIENTFPQLVRAIKWNQAMYVDHDTFIIGFSFAKNHLSIAPETKTIKQFETRLKEIGYRYTDNIIRIAWDEPMNLDLITDIVRYNIEDKKDVITFWR